MYNKVIFGLPHYNYITSLKDITKLEFMILFPIILGTIILGIYPKLFLDIFLFNIYYYFNFIIY
jgi:NADH:ubiquinone oxidoreductase subunit 4 (subunit M)